MTIEDGLDWHVKQKGEPYTCPQKKNQNRDPEHSNTAYGKWKACNVDIVQSKRPRIMTLLQGVTWDGDNWSCGYDSFIVSIYSIWRSNPNL